MRSIVKTKAVLADDENKEVEILIDLATNTEIKNKIQQYYCNSCRLETIDGTPLKDLFELERDVMHVIWTMQSCKTPVSLDFMEKIRSVIKGVIS